MHRYLLLSLAVLLLGCGDTAPTDGDALDDAAPVVARYATIVHQSYVDSLAGVRALETAIDAFLAAPSDDTLQAARAAWLASRETYGQTEAYRFYGGPIDNEEDGPEGLINAWPVDENYIDYVEGAPDAGIVQDVARYPTITKELLVELNEKDGEANIASGFHALEFLLWGQDLSTDGPGSRPASDYVDAPHAERRGAYLRVACALLIDHLESLVAAWKPDADNYRKELLALPPRDAVERILIGIGSLSGAELAGERMTVAYDTKSQEDEHSCFSDNTHRDIHTNALGIRNVWRGAWNGQDGPGLDELVASRDAALAERLGKEMDASLAAIAGMPVPFDQAVLSDEGRPRVLAAISALQQQTKTIAEVADALQIRIPLE